jgi:2-phosphosulfolactate phosphatase
VLCPAEIARLNPATLAGSVCVVFDVLRATTTMLTALANGARRIIPVSEIPEALEWRTRQPDVLLAGERGGLRIRAGLTGGVEFDFGNSPREFGRDRVAGRTIVMTTTNGTRALQACRGADRIVVAALRNLNAVAAWVRARPPRVVRLICSGTEADTAYEDVLAAGALCERLWAEFGDEGATDAAHIARGSYLARKHELDRAIADGRNGRRLRAIDDFRDDATYCAERDVLELVAELTPEGVVPAR